MTTLIPFSPSPGQSFAFQASLDNVLYQMSVTWNVYGQRWYLNCYTSDGTRIFSVPVISSPDDGSINIVGAYFALSRLVFRQSTQQFEITP